MGDVVEINPKTVLPLTGDVTFIPMTAVSEESGHIDISRRRPVSEVAKGYTRFQSGDVLFAKITPCMENGKVAVVPVLPEGVGAGSTEFIVLRSTKVLPRFLFLMLVQSSYRGLARFNMTGTAGQLRVPLGFIRDSVIPLPPLETQRTIVARIDELFAEVEDGEDALARARADLGIWRKALLKAAVTGELTTDWRAANPPTETGADLLARILAERRARWLAEPRNKGKKYAEPAGPDTTGLPELPEGWVWATLPQLGDFGRGKSKHRPRNDARLYGGKHPFVQTGVVTASRGRITTFDQTYSDFGLAQSKLWPTGTLCITIAANIAKTGVLQFDACFPDSIIGLSCVSGISANYIELVIRTLQAGLEKDAPATAQKNINLETFEVLAVPLPPSQEQLAIVNSFADAEAFGDLLMRNELDEDVTKLRQSILAAAFRGALFA